MAKYNGPVCRFCRREGQKLFIKGERCHTDKCSFDRRGFAPGQHGAARKSKLSEYGTQLREKQKVRRTYGILERQFRNIFEKAKHIRGVTSEIFFRNLELRADNVIYRMGLARSRNEARQIVRHNHILVNGKRLNIPSAVLKVGDEVAIADKSKAMTSFKLAQDHFNRRLSLTWFNIDHSKLVGKIVAPPTRDDIHMAVKERLIVELYSK